MTRASTRFPEKEKVVDSRDKPGHDDNVSGMKRSDKGVEDGYGLIFPFATATRTGFTSIFCQTFCCT